MKSKIMLTLVERKGESKCHRGHKPGDVFDFDTERGLICPMAMHVAFPYVNILRYGGNIPLSKSGDIRFCCSDSDVINVFRIERKEIDDLCYEK